MIRLILKFFFLFYLCVLFRSEVLSAQEQTYDSLFHDVRTFLEQSVPDKSVPILLKIIESHKSNTTVTDYAKLNLAEAYRQKREYRKATELVYAVLANQTLTAYNRAYAYNRLAALYNEWNGAGEHRGDSTLKYSRLCLEISQKNKFTLLEASSQNELGYIYRLKGNIKNAAAYSLNAYENFYEAEDYPAALNAAINLAGAYLVTGEQEKGLQLIDTIEHHLNPDEYKSLFMRLYLRKSDLYSDLNNYKEAYFSVKRARSLQADVFHNKMNKQISEMSAKYDLQLKEQKLKEVRHLNKIQKQRSFFLTILAAGLVLVLIILVYTSRLKQKLREQAELIIKQENTELKAALDFKREELLYKGRELSKATGNIISFNDALKKIKQAVLKGDTKSALKIISGNRNLEHNWDKFKRSFEEVYPNFRARLHQEFPKLTENDGKLCAFLLMEMKTREIADLMGVSQASVSKSRNRLRKKLELPKGTDIAGFLKQFC